MKTIEDKRINEKKIVNLMIRIYCKGNHSCEQLCNECRQLMEYTNKRIDKCPFMENKTFCANCKVHCYNPEMRERIKRVMRYSGPRIIFYHPILALKHLIETNKESTDKKTTDSCNANIRNKKVTQMMFIILGFISLVIAAIGVVVPLLPTFPFACLTAYFFGKSSHRLDNWFKQTNLYKTYIESYSKDGGLTIKIKIKIIAMVSVLLTIGFISMGDVPMGRIILFFVWMFHLYYFIFRIKTI